MTLTRDDIYDRALALVAAGMDVPRQAIMGHGRPERIALARHILWYILREVFMWTYREISAKSKRGHVTVIHGVHKMKALPADSRRATLRKLRKLVEQAKLIGSEIEYADCVGARVVVQELKTGAVKEVVIDRLTKHGDGVKFSGNGHPNGTWAAQREYLILDRLT